MQINCDLNNDSVMIITLVLKRSHHSMLQSFLNYASIASKRRKHKASTYFVYQARIKADILSVLSSNWPGKPAQLTTSTLR